MWTFILCLTSTAMYQAAGKTEILLEEPRRGVLWSWHTTKKGLSGAGWNFNSDRKTYSVCDITISRQPTNWLRTNFIDAKDAKMLNIKLKYNLLGCPPSVSSFCNHKLSIYVLHVEKKLAGVDINPLMANDVTYQKVETIVPTVLPAPGISKEYDYDGKIITKKRGVYLAFLDQGACVAISSVIVSYNYCSEIDRVLVRFSKAAAPVNDSSLEEQTGRCTDVNSVNKVKLSGVCLSNGEWNITDVIKCLCKPGYELGNGSGGNVLECSACLKGFYKSVASNSKCDECPTNSASNTGRTGCLCHEGFYKKPGLHGTPCKALPKAPRNANVTVVKDTYVEIMWERTPDESDGKLRYSVDCFRCKSSKYKDCKESCGPSVEYKPNKDNVTDGTVAVNGLPPDSFLKFRVYSVNELNAQEKDRDKWNYVTVSAKTKAMHTPRPSTTITPTWPSTPRPLPWTMHPPRPSTTTMHTPRPSTTTMHPPRPSTTTMHTPRPSTTRPKFAFTTTCFPSSMVAHIARNSLPSEADVSLLHLNDPSCGVSYVTKKSVIITAPLKGCGTVRRNIGYKMFFHNKVVVPSGYGEKRSLSVFPFKCVYSGFGFP